MPQLPSVTNGFNNAGTLGVLSDSNVPDPSYSHLYFNDFDSYVASGYFIATAVGSSTNALTAGDGGLLLSTTGATINNCIFTQTAVANIVITAGKQLFFKTRLKLDDASLSMSYAGIHATSTTPVASAVDGLYFYKASGATAWVLRNVATSVVTDLALPAVAASTGFIELGFHYDGAGNVTAFMNAPTGTQVADGSTILKGAVGKFTPAAIASTAMAVGFGVLASTGVARTLTTDYLLCSNER